MFVVRATHTAYILFYGYNNKLRCEDVSSVMQTKNCTKKKNFSARLGIFFKIATEKETANFSPLIFPNLTQFKSFLFNREKEDDKICIYFCRVLSSFSLSSHTKYSWTLLFNVIFLLSRRHAQLLLFYVLFFPIEKSFGARKVLISTLHYRAITMSLIFERLPCYKTSSFSP